MANELFTISHSSEFQKSIKKCLRYDHDLIASSLSWKFYKEEQTKMLWVHICTKDLTSAAISINRWWKKRYPEFKMRIVSKKKFEYKNARAAKAIKLIFGKFWCWTF